MTEQLLREKGLSPYTALLFARPSFIEGVSRVLDLGGTLSEYNQSKTPQQADYKALRGDWYSVGTDLETGIG